MTWQNEMIPKNIKKIAENEKRQQETKNSFPENNYSGKSEFGIKIKKSRKNQKTGTAKQGNFNRNGWFDDNQKMVAYRYGRNKWKEEKERESSNMERKRNQWKRIRTRKNKCVQDHTSLLLY